MIFQLYSRYPLNDTSARIIGNISKHLHQHHVSKLRDNLLRISGCHMKQFQLRYNRLKSRISSGTRSFPDRLFLIKIRLAQYFKSFYILTRNESLMTSDNLKLRPVETNEMFIDFTSLRKSKDNLVIN